MHAESMAGTTTVQLGGRGGRTIAISEDLAHRLDVLAGAFGEILGSAPSRSFVAAYLVIPRLPSAAGATAEEIRVAIRDGLAEHDIPE